MRGGVGPGSLSQRLPSPERSTVWLVIVGPVPEGSAPPARRVPLPAQHPSSPGVPPAGVGATTGATAVNVAGFGQFYGRKGGMADRASKRGQVRRQLTVW
ncbi:hypothetical protein GCM10010166_65110 [Couchioplanes caeruleus subsp. azureus]|nr:hypothetical protein GCM10010166_65110 [Couchioplanes caeruleus subsp. azureus]